MTSRTAHVEPDYSGNAADPAGEVRPVATKGWPDGYVFGATRYADVILRESFRSRFDDLVSALADFYPTLDELRSGGGGRTVFVKRFDDSLGSMRAPTGEAMWGKQNITIEKAVGFDSSPMRRNRVRGHEIDMFGKGSLADPFPGIAVEMEWNNKDPFFDRDLNNFQALHREGAIAVGVIVTRGPKLQEVIAPTIRSKDGGFKYGQSTTHWSKLLPKVNLGGGGECPLLLIGIEPGRVHGIPLAEHVKSLLEEAEQFRATWRDGFNRWEDAKPYYVEKRDEAHALMPPVKDDPEPM